MRIPPNSIDLVQWRIREVTSIVGLHHFAVSVGVTWNTVTFVTPLRCTLSHWKAYHTWSLTTSSLKNHLTSATLHLSLYLILTRGRVKSHLEGEDVTYPVIPYLRRYANPMYPSEDPCRSLERLKETTWDSRVWSTNWVWDPTGRWVPRQLKRFHKLLPV